MIDRGGLVGPRLTTLIANLKGACHASFSTIRKFLRDVVRVTISRGQPAKIIAKVSQALEAPYRELREHLPGQSHLNVDETGHKQNGDRMWTWCFRKSCTPVQDRSDTRRGCADRSLGSEIDKIGAATTSRRTGVTGVSSA